MFQLQAAREQLVHLCVRDHCLRITVAEKQSVSEHWKNCDVIAIVL